MKKKFLLFVLFIFSFIFCLNSNKINAISIFNNNDLVIDNSVFNNSNYEDVYVIYYSFNVSTLSLNDTKFTGISISRLNGLSNINIMYDPNLYYFVYDDLNYFGLNTNPFTFSSYYPNVEFIFVITGYSYTNGYMNTSRYQVSFYINSFRDVSSGESMPDYQYVGSLVSAHNNTNVYTFNNYNMLGKFKSTNHIDFTNLENLKTYILNDSSNGFVYKYIYDSGYNSGLNYSATFSDDQYLRGYNLGYDKGVVDGSQSQDTIDKIQNSYDDGYDKGYSEGWSVRDRSDAFTLSLSSLFSDSFSGLLNGMLPILQYKFFGLSLMDVISLFGMVAIALLCIKLFL